ncbi:MAG: hypothetical protein KatS3mg105_1796 [Gemmatales bacterium]|nr:MAG: hypothetical protein KatS3mg105_1796 [Gemmatales bacterium]
MRKEKEPASRPVSRVLYRIKRRRSFLYSAGCPTDEAAYPEVITDRTQSCSLIWPCSRWGLPCQPGHPDRGALLPHLFTLTPEIAEAVCFLWHFPCPRGRWVLPTTVSCGARTFLSLNWSGSDRPAGLRVQFIIRTSDGI